MWSDEIGAALANPVFEVLLELLLLRYLECSSSYSYCPIWSADKATLTVLFGVLFKLLLLFYLECCSIYSYSATWSALQATLTVLFGVLLNKSYGAIIGVLLLLCYLKCCSTTLTVL